MARSLGFLDTTIGGQMFLRLRSLEDGNNYILSLFSGSEFSENDIIVGFPLLGLPSQIFSRCVCNFINNVFLLH